MHLLQINNDLYNSIEKWEEMPLSKAVELYKVINNCPEALKKLYGLMLKEQTEEVTKEIASIEKGITDEQRIKLFPSFYGEVLKVLSDVPEDIISKILSEDREWFYNQYCLKFVVGLLYWPYDYEYKRIQSFEHEGVEYHLPLSRLILGDERPMADSTTIEFTESADLQLLGKQLQGGRYEMAANIISILCRPEGEKYDEQVSLKRAEIFNSLLMDKVWEVFFCLREFGTLCSQDTLISSMEAALTAQRQEREAALTDTAGI